MLRNSKRGFEPKHFNDKIKIEYFNSKGQIAIYIIIALILGAAIILTYFQKDKLFSSVNPEIKPISDHIQDCLKKTSLDGIYLIGMQGGYAVLPDLFFETNISSIAYGYYKGKILFPTSETIEKQLNDYIKLALPLCVKWETWLDFKITPSEINVQSEIHDDSVNVKLTWPIAAVKGKSTYRLNEFSQTIEIRLGKICKIAEQIAKKASAEPGNIDLSYLIDAENQGFKIDLIPHDNIIVYYITDSKSKINDKDYIFLSANSFI